MEAIMDVMLEAKNESIREAILEAKKGSNNGIHIGRKT